MAKPKKSMRGTKSTKAPSAKQRAALSAIQQAMAAPPADLRKRMGNMKRTLAAGGIGIAWLHISYAGRDPDGNGWVSAYYVDFPSSFSYSIWPEWAYGVAEGALHFGKHVLVVIPLESVASGDNIMLALCSDAGP